MRHAVLLAVGCLIPACAMASAAHRSEADPMQAPQAGAPPADQVKHMTVMVGMREFDDNGLEAADVETQPVVGFVYDAYPQHNGSGYEIGFLASSDDGHVGGTHVEAKVQELFFGYRKTFMMDRDIHPLVGAGFSIM